MGNCINTNSKKPYSVSLVFTTWPNESETLIRYNVRNTVTTTRQIYSPCRIAYCGHEIVLQNRELNKDNYKNNPLATVSYGNKNFWVYNDNKEPIGIIVKNLTMSKYEPGMELAVNDIFKLGLCKFKVKEINLEKQLNSLSPKPDCKNIEKPKQLLFEHGYTETSILNPEQSQGSLNTSFEVVCRICLSGITTADNPLMESPCKCIGSIKFMHVDCFKMWLKSKVIKKTTKNIQTYYWKTPKCDVCKIGRAHV